MRELLTLVEEELAIWCCRQLGIVHQAVAQGLRLVNQSTAAQLSRWLDQGRFDPAPLWQGWAGTFESFYVSAWRLVEPLSWAEVLAIGGVRAVMMGDAANELLEVLNRPPPMPRLTVANITVSRESHEKVRIAGYRPYNPLVVSRELVYVLPYFDGRDIGAVSRDVEEELGLTLDPSLVRQLADFGILIEASGPPA